MTDVGAELARVVIEAMESAHPDVVASSYVPSDGGYTVVDFSKEGPGRALVFSARSDFSFQIGSDEFALDDRTPREMEQWAIDEVLAAAGSFAWRPAGIGTTRRRRWWESQHAPE